MPPQLLDYGVGVDEGAVRRVLRSQIAHLEDELAALFVSAYPRKGFEWRVGARRGPRVLSLAELEELRDALAARLQHNRKLLEDRGYAEEAKRRQVERMLVAPAEHRWERVRAVELGETSCREWRVVPRYSLLGMLLGWWRVKISSGCPLARGAARPRVG